MLMAHARIVQLSRCVVGTSGGPGADPWHAVHRRASRHSQVRHSRYLTPDISLPTHVLSLDRYDYTIDDSISRFANTHRDCSTAERGRVVALLCHTANAHSLARSLADLILGVGDGKLNEFRAFQYSPYVLSVFDDLNMRPDNNTWHPKIKNTVYYGTRPARRSCARVANHVARYGLGVPVVQLRAGPAAHQVLGQHHGAECHPRHLVGRAIRRQPYDWRAA